MAGDRQMVMISGVRCEGTGVEGGGDLVGHKCHLPSDSQYPTDTETPRSHQMPLAAWHYPPRNICRTPHVGIFAGHLTYHHDKRATGTSRRRAHLLLRLR